MVSRSEDSDAHPRGTKRDIEQFSPRSDERLLGPKLGADIEDTAAQETPIRCGTVVKKGGHAGLLPSLVRAAHSYMNTSALKARDARICGERHTIS
jgi:hypothetical protein